MLYIATRTVMVTVGGMQRFVYTGQCIPDTVLPADIQRLVDAGLVTRKQQVSEVGSVPLRVAPSGDVDKPVQHSRRSPKK